MRTKLLFCALVTGAVCLAAVSVAGGSGRRELHSVRTIRVIEHAVHDHLTDLPPAGDSAGDLLTFANPVFDRTDSHRVGRDLGSCIRIVPGASFQCSWTTFLDDGSITVEGPFYDTRDSRLAITGGTGVFRNVRGQMLLHARADGNFDFVFHVQP